MRALRLRTQLVLVVLAASLPLLAFALGMGAWSARQHEEDIEAGLRQTAAALALAVRRELDVAIAMLEAVSRSRTLDGADFERFYTIAKPIGERFGGWVVAVDPDGDQLVSTLYPFGTSLTRILRREWLDRALETGHPVVSEMFLGAVSRRHVVSILAPVMRDGRPILALGLAVGPERFAALLAQEAASTDQRWLLVDGAGRVVASSHEPERYLGASAPEWLRAAAAEPDGVGEGVALDGVTVVGAIFSVPGTSWKVGVGAPAAVVSQAWWQPFGALLVGGSAIVLVLVAAAVYFSQRLARPFAELAEAADGVVAGETPPPSTHGIAAHEFLSLRQALARAGGMARDAAAASERAAVAEAEARTRALSEERLQFLVNELDHRVKNVLAAIQALALQTGRTAESVPQFLTEFQARLMALASVHDLLGSGAASASLRAVIAKTIAPYGEGNRIVIAGDDAEVAPGPATALAMAIHELATNAHKHGALSVPGGHVKIAVRVDARREPRVAIVWKEVGGPAVHRPGRRGFGTKLLEGALADQLEGEVLLDFAPAGLSCAIEFPLGKAA